MATSLVHIEELQAAVNPTAENGSRGGLTANPDALLAVFDSIEQSVSDDVRPNEFDKKSPHVNVVFNHLPRH
jgi:hypothetical protein